MRQRKAPAACCEQVAGAGSYGERQPFFGRPAPMRSCGVEHPPLRQSGFEHDMGIHLLPDLSSGAVAQLGVDLVTQGARLLDGRSALVVQV